MSKEYEEIKEKIAERIYLDWNRDENFPTWAELPEYRKNSYRLWVKGYIFSEEAETPTHRITIVRKKVELPKLDHPQYFKAGITSDEDLLTFAKTIELETKTAILKAGFMQEEKE